MDLVSIVINVHIHLAGNRTGKVCPGSGNGGVLDITGIESVTKEISNGNFKASMDITIKGDEDRASVIAKASSKNGKSVTIRATINLDTNTITWSTGI